MAVKTKDIEILGASCTLWLENTPQFERQKTASIGNFQAISIDAGADLLAQVLHYLNEGGFEYVLGPMNGNSWQSYRFVTKSDDSLPFLMEPQNPDFYPALFLDAGFKPIGEYSSAKMNPAGAFAGQQPPDGIRIRSFRKAQAMEELQKIWTLSCEAFAGNFLYTPIGFDDFRALYQPVLENLLPEFVLMAETKTGALKGFLFAIPDYAQGAQPDRLIVKTYASLQRDMGKLRIGGALLNCIHQRAVQHGFCEVVHGLMYDGNVSKKHSAKLSQTFRRYTLYGRAIKGQDV